jgi:hypothetical protein
MANRRNTSIIQDHYPPLWHPRVTGHIDPITAAPDQLSRHPPRNLSSDATNCPLGIYGLKHVDLSLDYRSVLRNDVIGILIQAPCLFFQSVFWYAAFFGSDLMLMPFTIATICLCCLMFAPDLVEKQPELLFGAGFGLAEWTFLPVLRLPLLRL